MAPLISTWTLLASGVPGSRRAGSDATSAPNAESTACRFIDLAAIGPVSGKRPGQRGPGGGVQLVAGGQGGGRPPADPGRGTWGLLPGMRRRSPKAESANRRLGEVARAGTQAISAGGEVKCVCAGHHSTPASAAPSAAVRMNRSRSCGRGKSCSITKPSGYLGEAERKESEALHVVPRKDRLHHRRPQALDHPSQKSRARRANRCGVHDVQERG